VRRLSGLASLPLDSTGALLKKYLQSQPQSLWSNSYAPQRSCELFNIQTGALIKEWLQAFFEYKNKLNSEEDSLNEVEYEKSNRIYRNIRDNQWELLALIVRGRPGVGKTSAIRAVAREMDIDLQECGSDYNQTKYLKEKHESTQSESVKNAYTKKPKVEKNAQMITKFMPAIEKEKPKENKQAQMVHSVSVIFPETEAHKFYNELGRCVSLSKIPFILTNSGEKIPKECDKYDIIDFESGEHERIHKVLWTITHLETLLPLAKAKEVQPEHLFEEINDQLEGFEWRELCTLEQIKEICELCSYRLDCTLTFLQHNRHRLPSAASLPFQLQKYRALNEDQLLEEIKFIDFQKLNHCSLDGPSHEKVEEPSNTQESTECEKTPKADKEVSLEQYRQRIHLMALEDTARPVPDSHLLRHSYDS
jgi:hypothetical protein